MELEEAKKLLFEVITVNNSIIKEARKNENLNLMELANGLDTQSTAIKTVLQAQENSVSKDVIKKLFNKKTKEKEKIYISFLETDKSDMNLHNQGLILEGETKILQELLEEKEK